MLKSLQFRSVRFSGRRSSCLNSFALTPCSKLLRDELWPIVYTDDLRQPNFFFQLIKYTRNPCCWKAQPWLYSMGFFVVVVYALNLLTLRPAESESLIKSMLHTSFKRPGVSNGCCIRLGTRFLCLLSMPIFVLRYTRNTGLRFQTKSSVLILL